LLDRFEITVGRFRKFVGAYPGNKPMANAGAHPLIPGSGWSSSWDASLPADQAALKSAVKCDSTYQTWTDTAGANENMPMNCINWFEAFAFCAWDGGRLPTEAEWNYAAAGGSEQREYPWSTPPNSTTIDASYAVYNCLGDGSAAGSCVFADILKVGSKSPKGDGRWGQADLGGSVWEWNLDGYQNPYAELICNNCANILSIFGRVIRGGSWFFSASFLLSSGRYFSTPDLLGSYFGARCARAPL
jgi:formylglycine-generating enzyme required for sulfatase activity